MPKLNKAIFSQTNLLRSGIILLFWALILILSWNNRFAVDDYYHIRKVSGNGIIGAAINAYFDFGGRWTSYLLWGVVYKFYQHHIITMLYSLGTVLFLNFSISLLFAQLKRISGVYFNTLFYSVLITSAIFFSSFSKGEIWFWVVSTAMYLNAISAFIVVFALILNTSKGILTYAVLAFLSVFSGGAAETYALVFISVMLIVFIKKMYRKKATTNKFLLNMSQPKLLCAILFVFAAFAISVAAPGNNMRSAWLPEPSFFSSILITFKALAKLFLLKFPPYLPYLVLFSLPWLVLGSKSTSTNNTKAVLLSLFKKSSFLITGIFFSLFPACYLLSEPGPDRSLSLIIVAVVGFTAYIAFQIGTVIKNSKTFVNIIHYSSMISIVIAIFYTIIFQYSTTTRYCHALDQRVIFLKNLQTQDKNHIEYVEPLPDSGYLYSAEISHDTAYFGNEHFRMGLFLDYKIAVRNK